MKKTDHCGDCGSTNIVSEPKAKARSYPQLKRMMALCREAFFHWPEDAEFKPKNVDHLRYWLELESGHFTVVKTIRIQGDVDPFKLAAVLTAVLRASDDDKMFVDVDGLLVTVKKVGSIRYEELEHLPACDLFNKVDEVLHQYGLDSKKLLKEAQRAA